MALKICFSEFWFEFFLCSLKESSTTVSFFRALFLVKTERSDYQAHLAQIIEQLLRLISPTQNPVLVQVLLSKRKLFGKPRIKTPPKRRALSQVLQATQLSRVEHSGKRLLHDIGKASDAASMVRSLSIHLNAIEKATGGQSVEKEGLLVDWLAEADSEMICSNQELQLDLLFSHQKHSFRPYLLSLLSHQSSWTTMAKVVDKLLSKYHPQFDSTCVLDFVDAHIRNPKLWQGRDRAVPKHEQVEYILELTEDQLMSMIQYILSESLTVGQGKGEKLNTRIHLLLHATDPKQIDLMKLINFVDQNQGKKGF